MNLFKRLVKKNNTVLLSYGVAIVMFIIVSILRPEFASGAHIKIMFIDAAALGMLALGQTFAIIMGGIDLSIQWNMCAAGMMITMLYKSWGCSSVDLLWMIPMVLIVTTLIGLVNGFGISYLGINPMIMTFGMNTIIQGLVVGLSSRTLPGGYAPEVLESFCLGSTAGIPNMVLLWILIMVIASVVLAYTPYGRKVYAVGNNETVAFYSGVKTKRIKMIAYAISGFAAGLGGLLFTGRIGQSYLGMGDSVMFETIAVVAIGGTSMVGGSGNYIGTVAGALILIILKNLLSAFLIPASIAQIIYGLVILIAMILSVSRSKKLNVV